MRSETAYLQRGTFYLKYVIYLVSEEIFSNDSVCLYENTQYFSCPNTIKLTWNTLTANYQIINKLMSYFTCFNLNLTKKGKELINCNWFTIHWNHNMVIICTLSAFTHIFVIKVVSLLAYVIIINIMLQLSILSNCRATYCIKKADQKKGKYKTYGTGIFVLL